MLEEKIFPSVCQMLGLPDDGGGFDQEVGGFINSAFMVLQQIGVTPGVFQVRTGDERWIDSGVAEELTDTVRTYVFLYVAFGYDPPTTSFQRDLKRDQLTEFEVRLQLYSEVGPNG